MSTINRCEAHPRYMGINTPRLLCIGCWRIYTLRRFLAKTKPQTRE